MYCLYDLPDLYLRIEIMVLKFTFVLRYVTNKAFFSSIICGLLNVWAVAVSIYSRYLRTLLRIIKISNG